MKNTGTIMPSASLQSYINALFLDLETVFPSVFNQQDRAYLESRNGSEGCKFYLTTLPTLGKAVEVSLIREEPLMVPPGFELLGKTRLPKCFNHLFTKVFDENGLPLQPMTHDGWWACYFIRQLTLMFSKVEGSVADTAGEKAVLAFQERTLINQSLNSESFIKLAREILERIFSSDHPSVSLLKEFQSEPWGRHGPGAVADHSLPGEKWEFSHWPGLQRRLFAFNDRNVCKYHSLKTRPSARVTLVPKDFKGPRIICIEPKENQFAQQGLMEILYKLMTTHPLTRRSICFEDVSISRSLCFHSDVATLDLKDASDNLSLGLARLLLPRWVFKLVTRYRTSTVTYKGRSWSPRCLATMGNACCFPLQTLIFWAIARSVVSLRSWDNKNLARNPVRVYGDDIIVPLSAGRAVSAALTRCGLRVNEEKTCLKTLVKESCGEWVLSGKSQVIIKPKAMQVSDMLGWVRYNDYWKSFAARGLVNLAELISSNQRSFIPSLKQRFNKDLQRLEWRTPTFASSGMLAELDGVAGLYAWHVGNQSAPFLNGTKLKVKMRWLSYNTYQRVV